MLINVQQKQSSRSTAAKCKVALKRRTISIRKVTDQTSIAEIASQKSIAETASQKSIAETAEITSVPKTAGMPSVPKTANVVNVSVVHVSALQGLRKAL